MAEGADKAILNQSRNDLHWSIWAGDDGFIRWAGYDDENWWNRVSITDQFRSRIGKVTGRVFRLDPMTNEVAIDASVPA